MIDVDIKKTQGSFALDAKFSGGEGVTALFGRSGAGKSTVVKAIAGLVRPDSGSIRVGDTVFFDGSRRIEVPAHLRQVGMVFQDGRLFPHLSVRDNLLYGYARTKGDKRVTLDAVASVLGIASLLGRRPVALSGGERQRVAVGRALLSQPRVLLMDEPLASLDDARKAELLPYFERLNTEFAIPILYVSHAVDEVVRLASDVALMAMGRVVASGSLAEVTSQIDLPEAAASLGSGAIIECRVEGHDAARGLTTLATAIGPVVVPLMGRAPGSRLSVRIAARDVAVALDPPARISVQNLFEGTVAELRPIANHSVRLRLAVGEGSLLSEVTADAVERLDLIPGAKVVALVKSVAIGR